MGKQPGKGMVTRRRYADGTENVTPPDTTRYSPFSIQDLHQGATQIYDQTSKIVEKSRAGYSTLLNALKPKE